MAEVRRFAARRRALLSVSAATGLLSAARVAAGNATVAALPARIVSVGSDATEIVYALGAGDAVVATDTTSVWPEAARHTPKVGYLRNLAAEGLLSLRPSLIVLAATAGPPTTLAQLRSLGVPMLELPGEYTLAAAREKIRRIGAAIGRSEAARRELADFDAQVQALRGVVATSTAEPRVAFLLNVREGSPQVAGTSTAADALLSLAGMRNAFAHEGYKAVSREALAAARPDVIMMMTHVLEASGGVEAVARLPGILVTPAGQARRILAVDPAATLGFGPRLPGAAARLVERVRRSMAG